MIQRVERFEDHALGRPFHAALLDLKTRSQAHGHRDYYEVMVVVAGDGEHHVYAANGPPQVIPLHGGDVVLVRPRDRHAIAGAVRFYNIAFPASSWRSFVVLAKVDTGWERAPGPVHSTVAGDRAATLCAELLDRFHRKPTDLDLIRFWTDVVPMLESEASGSQELSGVPAWLAAAISAMNREENLREGVPRLRALAHVSGAHLARSMRRHYDTTPVDLVAQLRLRHAATLLATTTGPIADIAYACGFVSPSYFTRRFREAHGVTPRQFRHNARHAFVPS